MKCALCENEYSELCQSHLIPKLVYKRIRSHPKSRFRNLSEIKKILQDGEKHYMLCNNCEKKFSKLETWFVNKFMDRYLTTGKIPSKIDGALLNRYIYSVSWRILHDDLYRMNSFNDQWIRIVFEEFEMYLRDCFHNDIEVSTSRCKNYIYKLESLKFNKEIVKTSESFLFGYSCYYRKYNKYFVITYCAGLIFVTTYSPKNIMLIDNELSIKTIFSKFVTIKSIARKEFYDQFVLFCEKYNQNMTPELLRKINTYYENSK